VRKRYADWRLPAHKDKHAQWLKEHEVPVDYRARTGTGDGGDFVLLICT